MTKDIEQLATKAAHARNRAAQAFTRALIVLAKGESNAKVSEPVFPLTRVRRPRTFARTQLRR